ncbi:MAG: hypothetical protein JWL85_806 [Candidatus Saccharibacteria bacterium]|nr:hypothetical protein [Candidatus Saccharibacteria bacterium]
MKNMSQQPEIIHAWERREIEDRATQLIDPDGQASEEFEAYRGTIIEPDENNGRAVRASEFATEPRFSASMEAAIEAHDKAVAAVAEWLVAQKIVDKTIYRIRDEERRKNEIIKFLNTMGYTVAPGAKFTFISSEES